MSAVGRDYVRHHVLELLFMVVMVENTRFKILYICMKGNFNYNTAKVDFEFFVYFIGPVVSIIAIMAAVILVHPEWVKIPKLAHADRGKIEMKK